MAARFTPRLVQQVRNAKSDDERVCFSLNADIADRFAQATRGYASQAAVKPPKALHGLSGAYPRSCWPCRKGTSIIMLTNTSFFRTTGKYASSAFVAAANKDAKTLDLVEKDLKSLKQLLHPSSATAESKKLRNFIANPTLSAAEKTKTLNEIVGGKEAEITKFVALVTA
jgi:F-type H+-transporting ATPase subunit O